MVIKEWNKLSNDCVNGNNVNILKHLNVGYLIKAGYRVEKIVGLSISQWFPCLLAIWNLLFWMAILLNLVKTTPSSEEVVEIELFMYVSNA